MELFSAIDSLVERSIVVVDEDFQYLHVSLVKNDEDGTRLFGSLLECVWNTSREGALSFTVVFSLTRQGQEETIRIDRDGFPSYAIRPFGDDLFACPDCGHYVSLFKEISARSELNRAYSHARDFLRHLRSCPVRLASVKAVLEIDKNTFVAHLLPRATEAPFKLSIWFRFAELRANLNRMALVDFYRMFAERFDKLCEFAVYDLEHRHRCELMGVGLVPLRDVESTFRSPAEVMARLQKLTKHKDGLKRTAALSTAVIPPTMFMRINNSEVGTKIFECLGRHAIFSLLGLLADEIRLDKDSIDFRVSIPTGPIDTVVKLSATDGYVVISDSSGAEVGVEASRVADLVQSTCTKLTESFDSEALASLRKKSVHDLVREHKYRDLTGFLGEPGVMFEYYVHLKEQLLVQRLEELGQIFERLWATGAQTSRDLLGILEGMHREVETASMLVFGTLAFQAYLFASRAITTAQLFGLLYVFGAGLAFFVMFTQFRISGIAESADLVIRNLRSVEKQVVTRTGLEISSEWKQAPEESYVSLGARIGTVETLLWAFLAANNIALMYLSYRLFASGVLTSAIRVLVGAFGNLVFFILFLGCLLYFRRDRQGLNRLRAGTSAGTLFLVASVLILLVNALLSVYCHVEQIRQFFASVMAALL
jgi:hypothetical protein